MPCRSELALHTQHEIKWKVAERHAYAGKARAHKVNGIMHASKAQNFCTVCQDLHSGRILLPREVASQARTRSNHHQREIKFKVQGPQ